MIGYPTTGLSKALRNKSERNGTQMTRMNMMNTDEILFIDNEADKGTLRPSSKG
ncbi:hypothetical protein B0F87_10839 [Methylobacter tundripaludum]|uniref:Uncharacterized protein n=1 Tax=Methylobacter tundripaludum TaxID=173365 RepID=A0A2S6HAR6_9GAMM|nr:hypothetical protein B0F87_10839 [Methylobacter tundripaludum]